MQISTRLFTTTIMLLVTLARPNLLLAAWTYVPGPTTGEETCFSAPIDNSVDICTKELAEKRSASAFSHRGDGYRYTLQYEKALADYTSAIKLGQSDRLMLCAYYYRRADAYYSMKKYKLAVQDYTKALDLNPKFIMNFVFRGEAYAGLGMDRKAFSDIGIAMKDKFTEPFALRVRADLLLTRNKPDQAIKDYQHSLALAPDNVYAMIGLGKAYLKKGMADLAFSQYDLALSARSDCPECFVACGNAFAKVGNKEKAKADYHAALAFPDHAIAPATRRDADAALRKLGYE